MLVVILGAGASYDSLAERHRIAAENGINKEWRPPLAKELFDLRPHSFGPVMAAFATAQAAFIELQRAIDRKENVEDAIERLLVNSSELGQRQVAAVLFYLQEIIWRAGDTWAAAAFEQTNYSLLVNKKIENWRDRSEAQVCYVTFNYDRMLERALSPFMTAAQFDQYVSGPTKLIKVHGSVDWGRLISPESRVVGGDYRANLVRRAPEWFGRQAGWARFENWDQSVAPRLDSQLMYPALALPTRGKTGFACPENHVEVLQRAIQSMDRLLVVGWRGQEQHMLDLLKRSPRPVAAHVVTSNDASANKLLSLLQSTIPSVHGLARGSGFSGYADSDDLDLLLSTDI